MSAFFVLFVCSFLLVLSISYLLVTSLVFEIQKLKFVVNKNLTEYLDLATTDQLYEEISKRDNMPIILVKMAEDGILVDCFNITPALSVQILEKSAELVREKIRGSLEGPVDF